MKNFHDLDADEINELIVRICINSNITDEVLIGQVGQWVNSTIIDCALLSLLNEDIVTIIDYDTEDELLYKMREDFVEENPQFQHPDKNPIWQQIAEIGERK